MSATTITPRAPRRALGLHRLAEQWLEWLQASGRAKNTILAYRRDLGQLVGHCAAEGVTTLDQLGRSTVERYLIALRDGEGNCPRTVNRKLQVVRGLLGYAREHGICDHAWVNGIRVRWQAPRVIAPPHEALMRLIGGIDASTWIGARDRAMFLLMYDAALRVSDVLALDVADPDAPTQHCVQPDQRCVYHHNKGGRTEISAITSDDTLAALTAWQAVRCDAPKVGRGGPLFVGRGGRRLSRVAVSQRLAGHANRACVVGVTTHSFKHARARDVYQQTRDIRLTQLAAKHKHAATTLGIYGHLDQEQQLRQLRDAAPLGGGAA